MRTQIEIDDELMAEAMSLTGIKSEREVVNTTLTTLVRLRKQMTVLVLEGNITWAGNLE